MPAGKALFSLSAILAGVQVAQAGINLQSSDNIAVYWGQNSYGQSSGPYVQERLSYYCQNPGIDVFQLAFVTVVNGAGGVPEVNFANAGNNCTTFGGTSLLDCPQIEEDIKACQKMGKTILLSIGGATYSEGGFTSESAALAGAELIWNTFGPVPTTNTSVVPRPFGDAVVDGFDFDFESTVSNMPAFANQLRTYFAADTSKEYYLTAAPQCVYPDAADNPMLDGTVYFDAIWVQFYNNYCGLQSFSSSGSQTSFNFDTWDNWAHTSSKNPNVKVFIGVPANTGAAGSGYVPASTLASIIDYASGFSSFGGIMMWDASQAYANSGFISGVAAALGGAPPPPKTTLSPTPTPTPTPTTTSTTSTEPTTSTSTSTPPSSPSPPSSSGTVPQWGQCGGEGYTGPTQCAAPYTCVSGGPWWSSCQ